jgi:ABC-2 type transport system permease protein
MSKIGHIAWKELRSYFTSWMAYALLAGWLLFTGLIWSILLVSAATTQQFQPGAIFQNLVVVLLFITPLLTMRLLAEERNSGTIEMLFTAPLSEWQVAIGKFLAAWAFTAVMLALTAYVPFFALRYGSIDAGPLWGSYIALLCLGAAFTAFGVFCSSLTSSQVVAGFLTFGGLLLSWMLSWPAQAAPGNAVIEFISQWSIFSHFSPMLDGAIDTRDLIFFVSIVLLCLFATVRVLESRKWRSL